jgi:hypothetical protein
MQFIHEVDPIFERNFVQAEDILKNTIQRIDGAYAPSTVRAYQTDTAAFIQFCKSRQLESLPAQAISICLFIEHLAEKRLSVSSIRRAIAGISKIHQINQFPDCIAHPDVKLTLRRVFRQRGCQSHQALGINYWMVKQLLPQNPSSLRELRDCALVLVAYDTLARRSELVAYEVNDLLIKHHSQKTYYSLRIKKSKTDQLALGRVCPIRFETYQVLNKWLDQANIKEGFLLRGIQGKSHILHSLSREQVNRIMKKLGRDAGFPAETIKTMSGHSLRICAAQDLLASGASMAMIMYRGRWSKSDTVMRYVEQFSELEDL